MANPVIIPNSSWIDLLNELVATGNLWDGAVLRLFKNNVNPTAPMALALFQECDFTGYLTSAAIAWNAAGYIDDGSPAITGDLKTFTVGPTPTTLNTAYGWYITDSGGTPTKLFLARKFDAAIVLSLAGQFIDVVPSYPVYLPR